MNYDIYVTNALTGNKEPLEKNCVIIDANHIEVLLKNKEVRAFNQLGISPYGNLNVRCMDRKTGDYYLKRGDKILIEECERIIPIAKYYNYIGIIFIETYDGEKFFLSYKLDPKNLNSPDNIQVVTTKYCILNKKTNKITAIQSFETREKNYIIDKIDKKEMIKNYIENYQTVFTTNQIKNELINEKIIDKTEVSLLLDIINNLLKEGTIEYFVAENKEIFYKIARKSKKLTKS